MSTKTTVARLEKAVQASQGLCVVTYKVLRKDAPPKAMTLEQAFAEARRGVVKEIRFPLTFNEEQAEMCAGIAILDEMLEEKQGIMRDTRPASGSSRLLLCTKPIVYAKQAPPKDCFGHLVGGNFITEDGQEFHQSEWQKILKERGAGFIVVKDYDESREPWGTVKKK